MNKYEDLVEDILEDLQEDLVDEVSEVVSRHTMGLAVDSDVHVWNPVKMSNKIKLSIEVYIWDKEKS